MMQKELSLCDASYERKKNVLRCKSENYENGLNASFIAALDQCFSTIGPRSTYGPQSFFWWADKFYHNVENKNYSHKYDKIYH